MSDPLQSVMEERIRQDRKWGNQDHLSNEIWLAILTEEVGETAKTLLEYSDLMHSRELLRGEVVQVCAVALAWLEKLEREEQHEQYKSSVPS